MSRRVCLEDELLHLRDNPGCEGGAKHVPKGSRERRVSRTPLWSTLRPSLTLGATGGKPPPPMWWFLFTEAKSVSRISQSDQRCATRPPSTSLILTHGLRMARPFDIPMFVSFVKVY